MDFIEQIINLDFWSIELWGNNIGDYVQAVAIFVGLLLVLKLFQFIVVKRLGKLTKKTKTDIDDALIKIVKNIKPPFYFILAVYFALKVIILGPFLWQIVNVLLIAIVVYQITVSLSILIDYILEKAEKREIEPGTRSAINLIGKIVKGILWVIAVLLALSNFGVNVTSLIAGLGIGGVAVALAAQNILGDLFSSFVIYFDKPFIVGDFIVVGDKSGTVEKIGIKTTRLKSLSGEELVFSNTELTSAQIRNYKKMEERRGVFGFGVTYDTPHEKLNKIPKIVEDIINNVKDVEFDRGFFDKFDDSAITFEVVYYVERPDYNLYAKRNQEIAFELKKQLDKEGIEMAFPTQTIYLKKE
jgi:small-conductance mechanosensitive channel